MFPFFSSRYKHNSAVYNLQGSKAYLRYPMEWESLWFKKASQSRSMFAFFLFWKCSV